jgi:Zn-dependent protease with chaperone function
MRTRTLLSLRVSALLPLFGVALIFFTLTTVSFGAYHSFQRFCVDALALANARVEVFPWITLAVPLTVVVTALAAAFRQVLTTNGFVRSLLRDEVGQDPLRQAAARASIVGRVRFVESPVPLAFCVGWLRPTIFVSTTAVAELSAAELEAVLRHESWHLRRRDPLMLLILNALATGLFLMPTARDLARHYALTTELRADAAATRGMSDRRPLASALYRVAMMSTAFTPNGAVGAFNVTDARIDQLLGGRPPAFRPRPLSTLSTALVLVGVAVLACLSLMAIQMGGVYGSCFTC